MTDKAHRPFQRSLIKLCFDIFGGRYSHAHGWWPGLRLRLPTDGKSGEIVYKGRQVAPLHRLDALGQRPPEITVVGSGPSIAEQDFSRLPDNSALLLNGAIHLLDGRLRSCLAVMVEDERFIWRHFSNMVRLVPPQTICLLSTEAIRAVCEISPGWLGSQRVIHLDFVQKPYKGPQPTQQDLKAMPFLRWLNASALSLDPEQGVFAGGSVATTAIQVALDRDPVLIGLAGIDLTNANEPRFYETRESTASSGILQAEQRILDAYAVAKKECEARGITLVNYSPVSSLSSIGVPYDDRLSSGAR